MIVLENYGGKPNSDKRCQQGGYRSQRTLIYLHATIGESVLLSVNSSHRLASDTPLPPSNNLLPALSDFFLNHGHRTLPYTFAFTIMDPVSAFGLAAGVAQFADLSARIVMSLYDYYRTVKHAPKLSKELRQEVFVVSNVLEDMRSSLESDPKDSKSTKNAELGNIALEFAEMMGEMASRIEVKEGDILGKLKWPFDQKENERYLVRLERFKSTFILALQTIERYISLPIDASYTSRQKIQDIDNEVRRTVPIIQDLHQMNLGARY